MISVIVPIFDEVESLATLRDRTVAALERLGRPFEIILVNDGSSDGSGIQ